MEQFREMTFKGVDLLVGSMGTIKLPGRQSTYTRTRDGKAQTFEYTRKESAISPSKTKGGYLEIDIRNSGKRTRQAVHRLVALAWCDGYADELCVNHINGIKHDNRAENLEWVSLARNTQHAWETGLVDLRGEKQPNAKLTSKRVVYIRKLLAQGVTPHALAIVADVSESLIYLIRDGKRWDSV